MLGWLIWRIYKSTNLRIYESTNLRIYKWSQEVCVLGIHMEGGGERSYRFALIIIHRYHGYYMMYIYIDIYVCHTVSYSFWFICFFFAMLTSYTHSLIVTQHNGTTRTIGLTVQYIFPSIQSTHSYKTHKDPTQYPGTHLPSIQFVSLWCIHAHLFTHFQTITRMLVHQTFSFDTVLPITVSRSHWVCPRNSKRSCTCTALSGRKHTPA
jgi:hypothetical protein